MWLENYPSSFHFAKSSQKKKQYDVPWTVACGEEILMGYRRENSDILRCYTL